MRVQGNEDKCWRSKVTSTIGIRKVSLLILFTISGAVTTGLLVSPVYGQNYVPHPPIFIESDEDFTELNGVRSGSGTTEDPYIIEGWMIVAAETGAIVIRDTESHVIIRSNYLSMPSAGLSGHGSTIHLINTTNVNVDGNEIHLAAWGVYAEHSDNIVIKNNLMASEHGRAISNAVGVALNLGAITGYQLEDSVIRGNEIRDFARGVSLQSGSSNVSVLENEIHDVWWTSAVGLSPDPREVSPRNIHVSGNVIISNHYSHGITLDGGENVVIEHNQISNTNFALDISRAFSDSEPNSVLVRNNTIDQARTSYFQCLNCSLHQNKFSGIEEGLAFGSQNLSVQYNVFKESHLAVASLLNEGTLFVNNTFDPSNKYHAQTYQYRMDLAHNWWGYPEEPDDSYFLIHHEDGEINVSPILLEEPSPTRSTLDKDPQSSADEGTQEAGTRWTSMLILPILAAVAIPRVRRTRDPRRST